MVMPLPVKSILYICTGNVLRSPVAAQITKQLLGDSDVKVASAGMLSYNGDPLSKDILDLARRYGVDLSFHRPRQVSSDLIDAADLILVFDKKQVGELVKMFPEARGKTQTLKAYAGWLDDKDMEDLWGKPVEVLERAIAEIVELVKKCVNRVRLD